MTDIHMPFLAHDMRLALELDAQDEREAAERAVEDARDAQAKAEAEAVAAVEALAEQFRIDEPPECETDGLPPMRARLVRFRVWLANLEAEHALLIEGRRKYLQAMGVPAATKESLKALIAADTTGLVAAMAQGGLSEHRLRSHERKQLEAKLVDDIHQAEVSRNALDEIERRIDTLSRGVEIVQGRARRFVADALQEHLVATTGKRLIAEAETLKASLLTAMGAHGAIQSLRDMAHFHRHHHLALPTSHLSGEMWLTGDADTPGHVVGGVAAGYAIELPVHHQQAEQRKWMAMAERLLDDPHADLGDDA